MTPGDITKSGERIEEWDGDTIADWMHSKRMEFSDYLTSYSAYLAADKKTAPPYIPLEYTGPIIGISKGDLKLNVGFGEITAGVLTLWGGGGGKSFGVEGQGNPLLNADGTINMDSIAEKGVKFPPEINGFCERSYMAITVIVKRPLEKTKKLRLKTKGFKWREEKYLVAPAFPNIYNIKTSKFLPVVPPVVTPVVTKEEI